jgi:hypothetical protein
MSMTHEQIEAMTDAEVDQFIAEKVMGWTLENDRWLDGPLVIVAECRFAPSIDLNQAIEAAEKVGLRIRFGKRYSRFGRFSLILDEDSDIWVAGWFHEESVQDDAWNEVDCAGRAPTPALAVCRAVIAAWEAKT